MDEAIARDIAHHSHSGQLTRHGAPMTEHVERVAAAVPEDARAVAFLHDVLEKTDLRLDELHVRGLTPTERAALDLLTRRDGETSPVRPFGSPRRTGRQEQSPAPSSSPISRTTSAREAAQSARRIAGLAGTLRPRTPAQ